MKKIICFLLVVLSLTLILCGCGSEEVKEPEYMPSIFKFGMTYDEASEAAILQELKDVDEGKHYISFGFMTDTEHCKFYDIDWDGVSSEEQNTYLNNSFANYMLTFNSSKELCSFMVYVEMNNTPNCAQYLFNHYIEFYEELLGVESSDYVEGNQVKAVIEKDNIEVSVYWEVNGTEMEVSAIVIDKNLY